MNREKVAAELGMLAVLAGAVFVLFWPAGLQGGAFFVQDVMVQNYPFRHFFGQGLKQGLLPLWSPAINCGFPLFAEGQAGVLYPFNLLTYLLLSTHAALNANILFHFWLAGAGTYLFLRAVGADRAAALTGGLAYSCSGFLVIRAMSPNYVDVSAWMPFLFLSIELSLQRRRPIFLILAAAVVGLQLLAGHPQAGVYGLLAAVAFGICRGVGQRAGGVFLVWVVLGIPLLGAGLAAAQLLPTAELARASARGSGLGWEQFISMSLPPERLVTLLLPNFFGNSGTGSYWGKEAGFFIQLCAYGGILPLLLGMVALRERRDIYTGFFALLCGLGLVLSLGKYTAVFDLLYRIPGMSSFRIPTRFLLWSAFGLAVLAGLGLDRVLQRVGSAGHRSWWWVCIGLAGMAGGMIWLNREVFWASDAELVRRGGESLVQYGRELRFDALRLGGMLLAGGWVLAWGGGRGRKILATAVPLLVFIDLYSFGRGFNGLIDPEVYLETPVAAQAILADVGEKRVPAPRIISLISEKNAPFDWHGGWMLDQTAYRKYPQTLRMYTGSLYGLENVLPGWSPLHLRRHWEFVQGYMGFADLAGIEYLVNYRHLSGDGNELIYDGEVKVYRNRGVLPRAYLVGNYQVIPESAERLMRMRSQDFDPRQQVVLEEEPDARPGTGEGVVRMVRHDPEEVVVQLEECGGGILVLSDTYYPGWEARVDGSPKPVLRANHVFRAVSVPAGARQVVFRFESSSFRAGAWLSGIAWMALVGLLVLCRRYRLESPRPLTETGGIILETWALQGVLILVIHGLVSRWPLWAETLVRSRALSGWGG